jgi:Flp pilus assembly protein TadD
MTIPRLALGLCLLALALCLWTSQSALAQNPPLDEPRYCTWLFWSKDPTHIKQALERLAQGDPFMIVARETARKHPKNSQANADCMRASGMDPAVLAVVKGLKIGEISRPFDLGGGTALVMRTTDQHRRKAQEYYSKGRYGQAERELLRDLRLHPASSAAWHMLALTRTAQGNYKQALDALDKALVWSPANSAMLNDKASALANLGRSKQAVKVFEKALKLDPKNPTIMSNLAWALTLIRKTPKRAEALAKQACDEAPQEARFWLTLGKVQAAQGEQGKAVVSFRQALVLEPKNKVATQDLVMSIKTLDPKVLARLSGKTPPPEPKAALKSIPKPDPKEKEQDMGKGLKRAPDLAGPVIALPSQWPSPAKPKAKAETGPKTETKTAAKKMSPPEAKEATGDVIKAEAKPEPKAAPPAEAQAKAPSETPSKVRGRIVSLPMPKFTEPKTPLPVPAENDKTTSRKEAAKPEAEPAETPKAPEAKPEPAKPEPEKAGEPKPAPVKDMAAKAKPKPEPAKEEAEKAQAKPVEKTEAKAKPAPKEQVKEKASEPEPKPDTPEAIKKQAEQAKPEPKTEPPKAQPKPDKPEAAEAKAKPAPAKPHYLIQVASYRPESLAKKELAAWQRRKMSGHIEKWQDKRGRTWHRVLLGPYDTPREAETKARALKAKRLVRDYYVVKRPSD